MRKEGEETVENNCCFPSFRGFLRLRVFRLGSLLGMLSPVSCLEGFSDVAEELILILLLVGKGRAVVVERSGVRGLL